MRGYFPSMPFKHNATRRYRIPRARNRITNWPDYEIGLSRRGDLTLWLDEAELTGWAAPRWSSPGGQSLYSDLAIELVLTLRLVFHLALRQVEAFSRCRFQKTFAVVTRRALQRAGIGMLIADRAVSMANQGGFRGPEAALAGISDDLGRARESPAKPLDR